MDESGCVIHSCQSDRHAEHDLRQVCFGHCQPKETFLGRFVVEGLVRLMFFLWDTLHTFGP